MPRLIFASFVAATALAACASPSAPIPDAEVPVVDIAAVESDAPPPAAAKAPPPVDDEPPVAEEKPKARVARRTKGEEAARAKALKAARTAGILGLLKAQPCSPNQSNCLSSVFGSGSFKGGRGGTIGLGANAPQPARVLGHTSSVSPTRDAIRRVIRRHLAKVKACYEAGLQKDPTIRGKVRTRFRVKPNGKPDNVRANGPLPPAVKRCVAKAFAAMQFPKRKRGSGNVHIRYPILFESSGGGAKKKP